MLKVIKTPAFSSQCLAVEKIGHAKMPANQYIRLPHPSLGKR